MAAQACGPAARSLAADAGLERHGLLAGGIEGKALVEIGRGFLVALAGHQEAGAHVGTFYGQPVVVAGEELFSGQVSGDRFYFDCLMKAGPAASRNAIALLKLSGCPESVTAKAMELAGGLSSRRSGS